MSDQQQDVKVAVSPRIRVVLDMHPAGEDMLTTLSVEVFKLTGQMVKLVSVDLLNEDGTVKGMRARVSEAAKPNPRVVYRVTEEGKTATLSGRKFQVRRYLMDNGEMTARSLWESLERETGEANLHKAIESALHGLRTEGVVESVEMTAEEEAH